MPEDLVKTVCEAVSYPIFNPSFVPIKMDSDTIHIRTGPWSGSVYTLRDRDEDSDITVLLDLLDGETPVEDILDAFDEDQRSEVSELLLDFAEKNVIYDAAHRDPDDIWQHLVLKPARRSDEFDRLDRQSVLVVDCGPMGGQIAADLASMGVGSVSVARPIPSARTTSQESEGIEIIDSDDLDSAIRAADFAVYAAEQPYPAVVDTVNEIAHESRTPWSSVQLQGFDGIVGPTVFPTETACYRCFRQRVFGNVPKPDGYRAYRETDQSTAVDGHPRSRAFGRMVAGYLGMDLLNLLADGSGITAGRVITVNGLDLSIEVNDVLKLPRCPVCGKAAGETTAKFANLRNIRDIARTDTGGSQ